MDKVLAIFMDPARAEDYSSATQIAEVVFEAATDDTDRLRYVAGADAQAMHTRRLEIGDQAFMEELRAAFGGE